MLMGLEAPKHTLTHNKLPQQASEHQSARLAVYCTAQSNTHLHILLHTLTYSRLMWPIGVAYLPHWVSGYVIVLCKYVPAYLPVLSESKEGLCSLCTSGRLQESLQCYGM